MRAVFPAAGGYVQAIDARTLGLAVVELGGGRRRAEDKVDPAVGLAAVAGVGAEVGPDRPLAIVHARDEPGLLRAAERLRHAYMIGDAPVTPPDVVQGRLG